MLWVDNDTASTDTRQSSTKLRQQGEWRQELFKTERLCFGFLCERPNYGDLKSCQSSYFRWLSARLHTAGRNIPRLFQTKVFKDLLLYPFSHSQTFLMPTVQEDQDYCARNNCFAEADHSTWLKGFGLLLLLLRGIQQFSWKQLQQEGGSYTCCLLGWIWFKPFTPLSTSRSLLQALVNSYLGRFGGYEDRNSVTTTLCHILFMPGQ